MKKKLSILAVLAASGLLLSGCSAGETKANAQEWRDIIASQPGVVDAALTGSTPLPFTYNPYFYVTISPEAENYKNLEKVFCESVPALSESVPVNLTIAESDEGDVTAINIDRAGKCVKLDARYASTWEVLDKYFPRHGLTVNAEENQYSLESPSFDEAPVLNDLSSFFEENAKNFPETFRFTTSSLIYSHDNKTINVSYNGTRNEIPDFVTALNFLSLSEDPIAKIETKDGKLLVTYAFGVSEATQNQHQAEINQLGLSTLTPTVQLAVNSGNSSGSTPEQAELADQIAREYNNTNVEMNINSVGVALFVADTTQALEITNYIAGINTNNIPIRINIQDDQTEKVRFDGYYTVTSEENQFKYMIEDYKNLSADPALLWTWFDGTEIQISVEGDYPPNSSDYAVLKDKAEKIAREGNYSSFIIRYQSEEVQLID